MYNNLIFTGQPSRFKHRCQDNSYPILRQGVPNLEAKVIAGPNPISAKNQPPLVGFQGQTGAQKTRTPCPHLLRPRVALKPPNRVFFLVKIFYWPIVCALTRAFQWALVRPLETKTR
jgi:hypothetical protein